MTDAFTKTHVTRTVWMGTLIHFKDLRNVRLFTPVANNDLSQWPQRKIIMMLRAVTVEQPKHFFEWKAHAIWGATRIANQNAIFLVVLSKHFFLLWYVENLHSSFY